MTRRLWVFVSAVVAVMGALTTAAFVAADPIGEAQEARGHDNAKAYAIIKPLADQGNAEAQAVLAGMYNSNEVPGEKPEEAFDKAIFWMSKAAEQGDPQHQMFLGSWLCDGELGTHKHADPVRAIPWLEKAAAQGHSGAMFELGLVYDKGGKGVPQDPAEAVRWYQKAVDSGNVGVAENLAALYAAGRGVPQDDVAAAKLYERAAKHGSGSAAAALGQFYEAGRGVPQDEVQAYAWYVMAVPLVYSGRYELAQRRDALAAKLNLPKVNEGQRRALDLFRPHDGWHALAESEEGAAGDDVMNRINAGLAFLDGERVPRNFQKAFAALQPLAEQGDPRAMFALGRMYEEGLGMEPDLVEAYVLYRIAGERSTLDDDKDTAEGKRLHIEMKMSPDLIDYARKRAMKWQPKQP